MISEVSMFSGFCIRNTFSKPRLITLPVFRMNSVQIVGSRWGRLM